MCGNFKKCVVKYMYIILKGHDFNAGYNQKGDIK